MDKQCLVQVSDNTIYLEQCIGGDTWRRYYQKVAGQWVSYRREKVSTLHCTVLYL